MRAKRTTDVKREFRITASTGEPLSGMIEMPPGRIRATAIFAHCFNCAAGGVAEDRISMALAENGIATL